MAEPTLNAADFDVEQPAAFYLPDSSRANMEALADATLVVGGKRLPAHSQVLSLQSGVLGGLFADLCGGPEGGSTLSGQKRKAEESQDGPVLEAPFQDASLFEACLFLRFCYQPDDLSPPNLAAVLGSLPSLLSLAHKLDAPQIQRAVCASMTDKVGTAALADLPDWVAAADQCQQPELSACCIGELARCLATRPGGLAAALADAALLAERCDKGVLAQLLGLVLAAGGEQIAGSLAAPSATVEALQQAANSASFEWTLEGYAQQPAAVGQAVYSPWFTAAGREWRFKLYPGGDKQATAGHLSVFLCSKQPGTRAKWSVTLVDQAAEGAQHICVGSHVPDTFESGGWGWAAFASHERLRARPGYLAGDRLVLRATVEVVL